MSLLTSPPETGRDATRAAPTPWRVLPAILLGTFLAQASYFVVNVALPAIGQAVHASNAMLQLVLAAYSVSYAGLLVAAGRLGDRYGRRRLFVIGLSAFAVGTLLSGLAIDPWTLTVARLVQGAAAGLVVPQVLGTIQATFEGELRHRALGYYAAAAGVACVLGQLLGGLGVTLDARNGWRWLFLGFAPLAVGVALVARKVVPESRGVALPVDGRGASLLMAALGLVIAPLSVGRAAGWPLWTWAMLAAGVLLGVLFVLDGRRRERRGVVPLLPPSLFAIPAFRRGLVTVLMFFVGLGGFFLVAALTMQSGLGMSAFTVSVVLAPYALVFLAASLVVPRLVARFDGGRVVAVGGAVAAGAYGLLAVEAFEGYARLTPTELAATFAIAGLGQALVMVPLFGAVLGQIDAGRAGFAAGVLSTTQQAGVALGVGLLGTVFFSYVHGPGGAHAAIGDSGGWGHATVAVFAIEAVLGLVLAAYALITLVPRDPRPRGAQDESAADRTPEPATD